MTSLASPLLGLPDAVAGNEIDAPVAAHYGSLSGEQRTLEAGDGFVDLSHRGVVRVERARPAHLAALADEPVPRGARTQDADGRPGPEPAGTRRARDVRRRRRRLLHRSRRARPGRRARGVAGPDAVHDARRGAGRHLRRGSDLATCGTGRTGCPTPATSSCPVRSSRPTRPPPGRRAARGPSRLSASPGGSPAWGWTPTTGRSPTRPAGSARPCTWTRAATAGRRRSRACTRWAGPRDASRCSTSTAPTTASRPGVGELLAGDKVVGFVGTSARHHELGPIALGMVKRTVPLDAVLVADGLAANQEMVVDPDVGLHVRPQLR